MTFDKLLYFARNKGLEYDLNSITLNNYTLYREGYIYLNLRYTPTMSLCLLIAENRTPKQMKQFIESLL